MYFINFIDYRNKKSYKPERSGTAEHLLNLPRQSKRIGSRELMFNSIRFGSAKEARKILEFHCRSYMLINKNHFQV